MKKVKMLNNAELASFCGELALLLVIIMNSFGVVLMLYSGSGISAGGFIFTAGFRTFKCNRLLSSEWNDFL